MDNVENLSKGIPDHEYQADANDHPQDDGVTSFAEVYLVHQVVNQRKLIGQIIELLKPEQTDGKNTSSSWCANTGMYKVSKPSYVADHGSKEQGEVSRAQVRKEKQ